MNKVINIKNFTKSYGSSRGVIDLNLFVEKGDIFGFMGPNGAGKSTTIRSILGLISPTSGEIEVFGKNNKNNLTDILKRIGYMPSEAMFYPNMKVCDVIKLAADIHKKDCSMEAELLCKRLKVDKKKRISELSLGNRKKVSIICAMQHKPELYIFDEPTSGLDPLMQQEFFNLIKERNEEGSTIFLSSHVLGEIQRYCNKVAIIKEGKLIKVDTVESLSKTKSRRVTIYGINNIEKLDEMYDVTVSSESISFLYNGEMSILINSLNGINIKDIIIEEPSLEDIFMHFYDGGVN